MTQDELHDHLFQQIKPVIKGKMPIYKAFIWAFICKEYSVALCMLCHVFDTSNLFLAQLLLSHKTLLEVDININLEGRSPLDRAVARCNTSVVRLLLMHDAMFAQHDFLPLSVKSCPTNGFDIH